MARRVFMLSWAISQYLFKYSNPVESDIHLLRCFIESVSNAEKPPERVKT